MDNNNAYEAPFSETYLPDEDYELFDVECPDDKLQKMLISELDANIDYWNQKPWKLQDTDNDNVDFLFGDQLDDKYTNEDRYTDNRLFAATRAILAYATGRLVAPEITPSRNDDRYVKMARSIQGALYQHSVDEYADQKFRAAVLNLIVRKRGCLKLRYDPNAGTYGDIVTEVVNPEDVIIDRFASYMSNPNKIYHRIRCTVEELCAKFPNKEAAIKQAYSIKQGRYSQMSRYVTYFECWFTYYSKGIPKEGVAWFIPESSLVLDKMPNPSWIYTGDDMKDKQENVMTHPPKPFIWFNFLNLGHSYIDETCLFEQAKPQQEMLNRRGQQIMDNADYVNGRWVASSKAMSEEDGVKFINKGPKTLALVDAEDVNKAIMNESATALPNYVHQTLLDTRNEIDTMMGTPAVFRGEQPSTQDTLGRDLMVKQQAGALQDDLVRAVQLSGEMYYKTKLQLMRVYYTDDYWFQVKGGDGKFDFIMLNGDNIDANVKIGVQVDSTLPLDKQMIRSTALELAKANRIDNLTLMEDLGLPDPEIRTERLSRSLIDPIGYLKSVEQQMDNNDAEVDIMLLTAGKTPTERDNYDQEYLGYYNHFLTTNRFAQLPQDAKQRLVAFLMVAQHLANDSANLQASMLDDAGITTDPITPPAPKRTENVRIDGTINPGTSQAIATGGPPPPTAAPPSAPPPK